MSYTNLQYLRTMTDNNPMVIREMIALFLTQVPQFIQNMNQLYQSGDYLALGKEAHKAKSSLQIIGMSELELEMKQFQLKTIAGTDIESYPAYIKKFELDCEAAIQELEEERSRLEG